MVFGHGDRNEGVYQDLLGFEGVGDGFFELFEHEAVGFDPLLEQGKPKRAIGAHADGAGEVWFAVDGDAHQVVRANPARGEVGGEVRRNCGLDLCPGTADGSGQEQQESRVFHTFL